MPRVDPEWDGTLPKWVRRMTMCMLHRNLTFTFCYSKIPTSIIAITSRSIRKNSLHLLGFSQHSLPLRLSCSHSDQEEFSCLPDSASLVRWWSQAKSLNTTVSSRHCSSLSYTDHHWSSESVRNATHDIVTNVLKNAAVIKAANDVQSFQDNLETINLLTTKVTVDDFPTLEVWWLDYEMSNLLMFFSLEMAHWWAL